MQTAPENGKGRRATNTTTPMQTGADFAGSAPSPQCLIGNPRHRRALLALLSGPQTREQIDWVTGASNGPDEVRRIRRHFGLTIPCPRIDGTDMDGRKVQFGIYRLTDADRTTARRLLGGAQ